MVDRDNSEKADHRGCDGQVQLRLDVKTARPVAEPVGHDATGTEQRESRVGQEASLSVHRNSEELWKH